MGTGSMGMSSITVYSVRKFAEIERVQHEDFVLVE